MSWGQTRPVLRLTAKRIAAIPPRLADWSWPISRPWSPRCVVQRGELARMRQLKLSVVISVFSACLGGCAAWDVDLAPERADKPWVPTTTASGEIVPGSKPSPAPKSSYALPVNTDLTGLPAPLGLDRRKVYSLP